MITGTVRVDLTDVDPTRQRHRAAAVEAAPDGARVVVVVAALTVEPATARLLRDHAHRLSIDVQGQPRAVQRWVDALRTGDVLPLGAV